MANGGSPAPQPPPTSTPQPAALPAPPTQKAAPPAQLAIPPLQPQFNSSHFKTELAGKPNKHVEAHLLRTYNWLDTHAFS